MPDQLSTPWSVRPAVPALPPAGGLPALAGVRVPAAGDRAGAVVLVTPWSSYRLPMPTVLPAVDGLPGLVAPGALVPRPRSADAALTPA